MQDYVFAIHHVHRCTNKLTRSQGDALQAQIDRICSSVGDGRPQGSTKFHSSVSYACHSFRIEGNQAML